MTLSLKGATLPPLPPAIRTRTVHGLVTSTSVADVFRCWIRASTCGSGATYWPQVPAGIDVGDAARLPHAVSRQATAIDRSKCIAPNTASGARGSLVGQSLVRLAR